MDRELAELLDLLIENERQMARYYKVMVDLVPAYKGVWESLSRQEDDHAAALERVRRAIDEQPHLYAKGKYTAAAARLMAQETSAMIDRILRREVHPQYAVSFISDIERSLLESQLEAAVRTDVIEIQNLLKSVTEETRTHYDRLRTVSL